MTAAWKLIRENILMGEPQMLDHFLGCTHEDATKKLEEGHAVNAQKKGMEGFFKQCLETFQHLAGPDTKLKKVPTPFIKEAPGPAVHPNRAGPWLECPFCCGRYHPDDFLK